MSAELVNTASEDAGFFSKSITSVVNLFTSFLRWSIDKYGDVKGRILALGLPGVILLWVIGQAVSKLFKKFVGDPAKKKADKLSREQFGTSVFNRKPPLTKQDIIRITRRYGCYSPGEGKTNNGHKIIMTDFYFGFPCHSVDFCDDAVRTQTGAFRISARETPDALALG